MVVTSLIFINIFTLSIGLLIIFLDNIISKYNDVSITINEDKQFVAKGGVSLLHRLLENKYFIPSACGGKGTCGYCRCKVHSGGGKPSPTESLILTAREMREGYRLTCQLKIREDIKLDIPEEYLEIQEFEGEIVENSPQTSDINKVVIKLLNPTTISFKPGQYVQIKVEHEGDIVYRAYSMASSPEIKDHVELNIKKIPDGVVSTYVHDLKVGDPISISGPYGDFYLRTDSHRKIICVAGGVGLAPMKGIVEYWVSFDKKRPIELYYGSRTTKDLYSHQRFVEIAEKYPNFKYYPALSDNDPHWTGERGFIHMVLEKHIQDGAQVEAYLCGPPIMIDAVTKVLNDNGVESDRIWYDKF